jgi:hypothetical protein
MNNQFDKLTKSLAQSVTRRAALKKFGLGLAGMALTCFGLTKKSIAAGQQCQSVADCPNSENCCSGICVSLKNNNNCWTCGNVCPPGTACRQVNSTFGHQYVCLS